MKYDSYMPHPGFESMFVSHTGTGLFFGLIIFLSIWSIVLKGFSLWYSARNGQRNWFLVMLVINTLGILEIVYLIWYRGAKKTSAPEVLSVNENKGTVAESHTVSE